MGISIEMHNITSWGGFVEILTASQAHLLLLQEAHADESKDKDLRATAAKLGWRMISSKAVGKNDGTSGGVAILTGNWLGLSW